MGYPIDDTRNFRMLEGHYTVPRKKIENEGWANKFGGLIECNMEMILRILHGEQGIGLKMH
jgi:hypothetical protein